MIGQRTLRETAGLAVAIALICVGSPIGAGAADLDSWMGCWKEVPIAGGTFVDLERSGDSDPQQSNLTFQTTEDVVVAPVSGDETLAGEIVKLKETKGRIVPQRGDFKATQGSRTYLIQSGEAPQLDAQPGTRIKLQEELSKSEDGKLLLSPGVAEIDLAKGEPLSVRLATDATLTPVPTERGDAWLEAGLFPVVSGGRSMEVGFHAPGQTETELGGHAFQACVKADGKIYPASVDVLSTRDGVATLAVWIPEKVGGGYTWLWQGADLAVVDTATGMFAGSKRVHVGNPLVSAIFALGLTAVVIWLTAGLMAGWKKPLREVAAPIAGIIDEGGGRKSLALFQIAAWTLLVLVGMFYVMFMSGNLLNISEEMLVLLGLAGLGTVAARLADPAPDKGEKTGFASMFFVGDKADLTRLQMFLFTVLIWIYVAWRIWSDQAFPNLGANVLLLMGISSGVYVAAKWAQTTSPGGDLLTEARRLRLALDTLNESVTAKQQEVARYQTAVDSTQDGAGGVLLGKEAENQAAKDRLQQAQSELTQLQPKLDAARSAWGSELDRLKTL